MTLVYSRHDTELTITDVQDLLRQVDESRVSTRPAQAATGDVFIYRYDTGTTKGFRCYVYNKHIHVIVWYALPMTD